MGNNYILAVDPRGYNVEMWPAKWEHLSNKHPDLIKYGITEDDLKYTIEQPIHGLIYQSKSYPENCCLYYSRNRKTYKHAELLVVVKFVLNIGEIVTFHFCGKRAPGEVIIWPSIKS